MQTSATTSPPGATACGDPRPVDAPPEDRSTEARDDEARRRWLATAAWPEVAFASA